MHQALEQLFMHRRRQPLLHIDAQEKCLIAQQPQRRGELGLIAGTVVAVVIGVVLSPFY